MQTHAAPCTSHGASFQRSGYSHPSRSAIGVASTQGSHPSACVMNKYVQRWCMCSARITTTVCVASHSANPAQIAPIQHHLGILVASASPCTGPAIPLCGAKGLPEGGPFFVSMTAIILSLHARRPNLQPIALFLQSAVLCFVIPTGVYR